MHFHTNGFAQRLIFAKEAKVNHSSMSWLREPLILINRSYNLCHLLSSTFSRQTVNFLTNEVYGLV